jgi:Putative inner membrane protein (DUF1819)
MTAVMLKDSVEKSMMSLGYGAEVNKAHSRMLRIPLVLEETRAYWTHWKGSVPKAERSQIAFEERWFGSKSMKRVQALLSDFGHRFEAYPTALAVLTHWCPQDPMTRQNICHWHTQLTDPVYRQFTGSFLAERALQAHATIDRDVVYRWVVPSIGGDWSAATVQRMATSLLTSATSAGLCSDSVGSRQLEHPRVTDEALAYWMYFLRGLTFDGSLLNNPYLRSVGLSGEFLEQRLRRLPGIGFARMGDLYEFEWKYPDLMTWAEKTLDLRFEVSA